MEGSNLQFISPSKEQILSISGGRESFERAIGFPVADGLMEFFPPNLDPLLAACETALPLSYSYLIIHKQERCCVGLCGFKPCPGEDQVLEIAYAIAPSCQNNGFATQTAGAMCKELFHRGLKMVRAHTLPEENASSSVLKKNGFTKLSEVVDPEDGWIWRWERSLAAD
jgi:ribosomal-protein-alanine N-acetyltransferase